MNIKFTSSALFITILLLSVNIVSAQKPRAMPSPKDWSHSKKNCHHLLSNSSQCGWVFFNIKGTLQGTIVSWNDAPKSDKPGTAAAVAIIKTNRDTVRVLLLENKTMKPGQTIKLAPATEPDVDVSVALDRDFYLHEEKEGGKPFCRINEYDQRIVRTTWGKME